MLAFAMHLLRTIPGLHGVHIHPDVADVAKSEDRSNVVC